RRWTWSAFWNWRLRSKKLLKGCRAWQADPVPVMREYAERALEDSIDADKSRKALASMNEGVRERFMRFVSETLPEPSEPDWRQAHRLWQIRRVIMEEIARRPAGIRKNADLLSRGHLESQNARLSLCDREAEPESVQLLTRASGGVTDTTTNACCSRSLT